MGAYSQIEWCDCVLNLFIGCRNGCPYCYARKFTDRFKGDVQWNKTQTEQYRKDGDLYIVDKPFIGDNGNIRVSPFGFEPTFFPYKFHDYKTKRMMIGYGKKVFVGSLCDMWGDWIPEKYIWQVIDFCQQYEWNTYLFLTKHPKRYTSLKGLLPDASNFWYGTTVTSTKDIDRIQNLPCGGGYKRFISYEPMHEALISAKGPLNHEGGNADLLRSLDWIIMGAETGKERSVIPKKEWAKDIVELADAAGIPVFMKDSLIPIVGEKNMRRDYPQELQMMARSQKLKDRVEATCMKCGYPDDKRRMIEIRAGNVGAGGKKTMQLGFVCSDCMSRWAKENHREIKGITLYDRKPL